LDESLEKTATLEAKSERKSKRIEVVDTPMLRGDCNMPVADKCSQDTETCQLSSDRQYTTRAEIEAINAASNTSEITDLTKIVAIDVDGDSTPSMLDADIVVASINSPIENEIDAEDQSALDDEIMRTTGTQTSTPASGMSNCNSLDSADPYHEDGDMLGSASGAATSLHDGLVLKGGTGSGAEQTSVHSQAAFSTASAAHTHLNVGVASVAAGPAQVIVLPSPQQQQFVLPFNGQSFLQLQHQPIDFSQLQHQPIDFSQLRLLHVNMSAPTAHQSMDGTAGVFGNIGDLAGTSIAGFQSAQTQVVSEAGGAPHVFNAADLIQLMTVSGGFTQGHILLPGISPFGGATFVPIMQPGTTIGSMMQQGQAMGQLMQQGSILHQPALGGLIQHSALAPMMHQSLAPMMHQSLTPMMQQSLIPMMQQSLGSMMQTCSMATAQPMFAVGQGINCCTVAVVSGTPSIVTTTSFVGGAGYESGLASTSFGTSATFGSLTGLTSNYVLKRASSTSMEVVPPDAPDSTVDYSEMADESEQQQSEDDSSSSDGGLDADSAVTSTEARSESIALDSFRIGSTDLSLTGGGGDTRTLFVNKNISKLASEDRGDDSLADSDNTCELEPEYRQLAYRDTKFDSVATEEDFGRNFHGRSHSGGCGGVGHKVAVKIYRRRTKRLKGNNRRKGRIFSVRKAISAAETTAVAGPDKKSESVESDRDQGCSSVDVPLPVRSTTSAPTNAHASVKSEMATTRRDTRSHQSTPVPADCDVTTTLVDSGVAHTAVALSTSTGSYRRLSHVASRGNGRETRLGEMMTTSKRTFSMTRTKIRGMERQQRRVQEQEEEEEEEDETSSCTHSLGTYII